MADFNQTLDAIVERGRQEAELASQADAAWRILLMAGAGLLVVLAVAAVILAACWCSQGWRKTPPPPKSIIPALPDKQWRYTAKTRR
ncbi:MAG: hypothetical protein WCJ18_00750 [Planctomycetota bacterium]